MPRLADMFTDLDADPRAEPPARGDELATLTGFLRWQRQTLELKCGGLDAVALARRSVESSTLSLLGLVRHLADVERFWFRVTMAGQHAPARFATVDSPDGDFDGALPDPRLVDQAFAAWRAEITFADELVAQAPDLDTVGRIPDAWRGPMSLRWVLVHMIEEYARHNGHADLLRQQIDGATGQ